MNDVRSLLSDATARLAAAGVPSPRVDAELLLAHRLGVARSALLTRGDDLLADVLDAYADDLARRAGREPLQYITGRAPFRRLELAVGPGVFIPRPETELLVDAVLPHLRTVAEPVAVDLCAGCGALGLAVADEVPGASVVAVERDAAAIGWLTRNAADGTVRVVAGDVRDPELLQQWYGRTDAVLSNPPYVPAASAVGAEVRADPAVAVFAGADGLELIPVVIERAARLLRPGGRFALEHDDTQADAVPALLHAAGAWVDVEPHRDLAGAPRFVVATRR